MLLFRSTAVSPLMRNLMASPLLSSVQPGTAACRGPRTALMTRLSSARQTCSSQSSSTPVPVSPLRCGTNAIRMMSPPSRSTMPIKPALRYHSVMMGRLGTFSQPASTNKIGSSASPALSILVRPSSLGTLSYFSSSSFPGGNRGRGGGNRLAQGAGLIGAASILFGKTKYVLAALKLTKLASLGSMVLTIGTYSMFFGLPYAAGMVGLILVHESGHALAMRQFGVPFSPMVFLPFMGAVIAMRDYPRDAWQEALIAMAGPVAGTAGAVVVAAGAQATDSQLLYALADFGFMINLFNMLPVGSMDGGRIVGALSPYASLAGLGLGGAVAFSGMVLNPLYYLILLAGGYSTFMRFYDPGRMPPNYYNISTTQRFLLTSGYFGLIGFLVLAMGINHQNQKPPEVLIRERQGEMVYDMRY